MKLLTCAALILLATASIAAAGRPGRAGCRGRTLHRAPPPARQAVFDRDDQARAVSADRVTDKGILKIEQAAPQSRAVRADPFHCRQLVLVMAHAMPQIHFSRHPLDDEMSRRWFDNFLGALDSQRMYFTRDDVDRFAESRDNLDDLAKRGDVAVPFSMRDTLLQRRAQVAAWAVEFAQAKHDFTLDEVHTLKHGDFAADLQELRERWRKRIKYELLLKRVGGIEKAEAAEYLESRYSRLRAKGMTDEKVIEVFLATLANSYDPHTDYWPEDALRIFMQ